MLLLKIESVRLLFLNRIVNLLGGNRLHYDRLSLLLTVVLLRINLIMYIMIAHFMTIHSLS